MEALQRLFLKSEINTPTVRAATREKLLLGLLCIASAALVFIKPLPFPWKNPAIALLGMACWRWIRDDWKELGLSLNHSIGRTLIWALLLSAVGLFVVSDLLGPLIDRLTGHVPDYSGYAGLVGDFDAVFGFWWKAMISAGMAEEVIYRGILLVGLSLVLDRGSYGNHISILFTAILFGLAHYAQGPSGMIMTGLIGYTFGYGFYLSGRNIYALILAHMVLDSWAMVVLYNGWFDSII